MEIDGPRITELRMHPFKSYVDATLAIAPLTIVIGRNASGKSNALDALEFLGRVSRGVTVKDALDGTVEGIPPLRGGSGGVSPAGSESEVMRLGITVQSSQHGFIDLDIEVSTGEEPRIVSEKLTQRLHRTTRPLIESLASANNYGSDIEARIWNQSRGRSPRTTFRSSQLLTFQYAQRDDSGSKEKRIILECCDLVLSSLLGVFHLDPVPSLMRGYVPERDHDLRRDAANISAVLNELQGLDPQALAEISEVAKQLPEHQIEGFQFVSTDYGDVMLGLEEKFNGVAQEIPAKQMSDGMLRIVAIAAAVLGKGVNLAIPLSPAATARNPTIVIEELENGLHPSQARLLLNMIVGATNRGDQVILTTHSPALLDAISGDEHSGVVVINRDPESGWSTINRLIDLPGYNRSLASDSLGGLVQSGAIDRAKEPMVADVDNLRSLLGIADDE